MGTQKNRLNEAVLLSTKNICCKLLVRKYLQFYAGKFCLSKPVGESCSEESIGLQVVNVYFVCNLQYLHFSIYVSKLILRKVCYSVIAPTD